jgi:phage terminase small subunit
MRDNKLTDLQALFVLHFTSTPSAIGNASEAARLAGYSEKTASEQGHQLLQKAHVIGAITEANHALISSTMATKSAALLEKFVDDETVSARVRLDAAKTILDRAGYIPPKAAVPEDDEKPMEEWSVVELEEFISRGEKAARERPRVAV